MISKIYGCNHKETCQVFYKANALTGFFTIAIVNIYNSFVFTKFAIQKNPEKCISWLKYQ